MSRVEGARLVVDIVRFVFDVYETHRGRKEREANAKRDDRIRQLEAENEKIRWEYP